MEINRKGSYSMKLLRKAILLSGIVLFVALSCVRVPKEPLTPGKVRLLSIDIPGVVSRGIRLLWSTFSMMETVKLRLKELVSLGQGRVRVVLRVLTEPSERRDFSKFSFPGWGPDHTELNVMLSMFEMVRYKTPIWLLYKSWLATDRDEELRIGLLKRWSAKSH